MEDTGEMAVGGVNLLASAAESHGERSMEAASVCVVVEVFVRVEGNALKTAMLAGIEGAEVLWVRDKVLAEFGLSSDIDSTISKEAGFRIQVGDDLQNGAKQRQYRWSYRYDV